MPRPRVVEAPSERVVSRKDSSLKKSKTPVAVVTAKRVVVSGKMPRKMPKSAAVRAELAKKEKKERAKMIDDEAEEEEAEEAEEAPKKSKKRAASESEAAEEEEENEAPVQQAKKSKVAEKKRTATKKKESKDDDEATADEAEDKEKKKRAKPRFKKHTMHVREMKFLQEIPNEQLLKSKTAHRRARKVADGDYRFTRDAVMRIAEIAVGMSKLDICRARALNQFVSFHDGTGLANPGPLRASALSMAHLLAPH